MDVYELDAIIREFTPHQFKLLEGLYKAGGEWLTRIQLARSIGRSRLTPYDIGLLKGMTEKGLILMSTQPTNAPGWDFAYIYSMSDEIAYVLQQWAEFREQLRAEIARKRPPINFSASLIPDETAYAQAENT